MKYTIVKSDYKLKYALFEVQKSDFTSGSFFIDKLFKFIMPIKNNKLIDKIIFSESSEIKITQTYGNYVYTARANYSFEFSLKKFKWRPYKGQIESMNFYPFIGVVYGNVIIKEIFDSEDEARLYLELD